MRYAGENVAPTPGDKIQYTHAYVNDSGQTRLVEDRMAGEEEEFFSPDY